MKILSCFCAAIVLTGCLTGTHSREDKMANAAAVGALTGGMLAYSTMSSNRFLWALIGGVAGGAAGHKLMDEVTAWDRKEMEGTIYKSLTE
ncbi:MAG: hypothetical protein R3261_10900, partial [Alphaproteobacteria bacterium]|nr:hypothetical protein [Alphaproteobacteria bacterium]